MQNLVSNTGGPPHSVGDEKYLLGGIFIDPQEQLPAALEDGISVDSFHVKEHRVIFGAIVDMHRAGDAIGLGEVASYLSSHGKLGDAGGPVGLAGVARCVPTNATSGTFRQEVRKLHVERQVTALGADLSHALRANDLAKAKRLTLELQETTESLSGTPKARLRGRLRARAFNYAVQPPEPIPRWLINGKAVCTPGNLTNLIAQAKAGKSAVVGAMVAAVMVADSGVCNVDTLGVTATAPGNLRLLHFDTEQSTYDHDRLVRTALRRAGAANAPGWLESYSLAGYSAADARSALLLALEDARQAGGVFAVMIDGAADLVNDVNDAAECNGFVAELHALAIKYDCPIVNVIHENPGSDSGKMRGHLGSQLERKAESNLRLKKSDGVTVLFSERQRQAPILEKDGPRFQWSDAERMHVSTSTKSASQDDEKRAEFIEILEDAFEGERLSYTDARMRVEKVRGCSRVTAERMLAKALKVGALKKTGMGHYEVATLNPH